MNVVDSTKEMTEGNQVNDQAPLRTESKSTCEGEIGQVGDPNIDPTRRVDDVAKG